MTDIKNTLKYDFENSFEKSLKSLGYLIPTSEDEVDYFEENNKIDKVPEHYYKSIELLSKPKHNTIEKTHNLVVNISVENLAIAARKGGDISEDIRNKMRSDRNKVENGEK